MRWLLCTEQAVPMVLNRARLPPSTPSPMIFDTFLQARLPKTGRGEGVRCLVYHRPSVHRFRRVMTIQYLQDGCSGPPSAKLYA